MSDDATVETPTVGDILNTLEGVARSLDSAAQTELPDMSRLDLAATNVQLTEILFHITHVALETQRHLAQLMELDTEMHGGFLCERTETTRTQWDADAARSALTDEIVVMLATNPETGERIKPIERAIVKALSLAYAAVSSAPKASLTAGGLKAVGLSPSRYRTVESTGYRVKVTQP